MSTLSSLLRDLLALFFPSYCACCGKVIEGRANWVCVECFAQMPTTNFHRSQTNPMIERLSSLCPAIESASALFIYYNRGDWSALLRDMKYRNMWRSAYKLGLMYGAQIAESPLYRDIDLIVPVPLHPRRRLLRRYNQSEEIAKGISRAMGLPTDCRSLRRMHHVASQVSSNRQQRWRNVQGIFALRRAHRVAGKHILLVDDVFTTGATLLSCAEAILAAEPSCRISVVTIAVSSGLIYH